MAFTARSLCRGNLRIMCLIIGYMNLIAALVDVVSHFVILGIVTRGFECDVDRGLLQSLNWPSLEVFLLILNVGTHGFYPFPLVSYSLGIARTEYVTMPAQPKCYPGMFHIYQLDILNFLINIIWMKFVTDYVRAVHKKDPDTIRMFFGLALVKLVLQSSVMINWGIKFVDICIASVCLIIINQYFKQLRNEKSQQVADRPPQYVECLVNVSHGKNEVKSAVPPIETVQQKAPTPPGFATVPV